MRLAPLTCLPLLALLLPAPASADLTDKDKAILKTFLGEFVEIAPGKGKFPATFEMGSSGGDAPAAEKPATKVTLARPFSIAKYEVTQELYRLVMGDNPSKWRGPRNSVEMIDWDKAVSFCDKVTALLLKEKLLDDKHTVRLPSEAEWEYCCRAGTKTAWSFGDDEKLIGDFSWYAKNAPGNDPPVGKKKPNDWGLYDMHGYVSEWCADPWRPTLQAKAADGEKKRIIRGGSFADPAEKHRSAFRDAKPRDFASDRIGFRCVKAGTEGK